MIDDSPAADTTIHGEIRRPLSVSERWYWICDQIAPLNVVARVRLSGDLPEETLRGAAAALAREQPLLRAGIATRPDGTAPAFVAPADPRLPVRVVAGDETAWEREVDHELATPLPGATRPLLRVTDVRHGPADGQTHDVIVTVSHVIADGTAALTLLRRLVELAAAPGSDRPRRPVPSLNAVLPRAFRGPWGLTYAVGTGLVDQALTLVRRPQRLRPQAEPASSDRRSRLLHRELSGDQTRALTAQCRAAGATVHGAIVAALARAYGRVVAPDAHGRVGIGSPVDLRGELVPPVAAEDAGVYVGILPTYPGYGPGADLWDVARGVNRELMRRKRFRQHLAQIAGQPLICPDSVASSRRFVEFLDAHGPGNICVSNIGRYDFPDRIADWRLSGAQFIAGISVSGLLVASVNTSHDALQMNVTYVEGLVTVERATRIADEALRVLTTALEHPVSVASRK
ncbi:hypothetical protein NDR87_00125 [Nocardia sp. CDC159]|uniref:Phthiocerol/phthiodiolone dimycocerosyl transferase n=1 Tax=Nocardia pulmonis TaxID=2951408 RepID=A0A9X2IVL0_9NOCA|nr:MULTISPECIES: hypothetical protein [Nocardia]MCM6772584.1 hypothetical protein [Nocardia pulmonis]MCM6784758.1 hypothetical protein [Nocardia sp. CDC159]